MFSRMAATANSRSVVLICSFALLTVLVDAGTFQAGVAKIDGWSPPFVLPQLQAPELPPLQPLFNNCKTVGKLGRKRERSRKSVPSVSGRGTNE